MPTSSGQRSRATGERRTTERYRLLLCLRPPVGVTCRGSGVEVDVEELRRSPVVGCEAWDEAISRAYALSSSAQPKPSAQDANWVERDEALRRCFVS